jgi:hypothetical protein
LRGRLSPLRGRSQFWAALLLAILPFLAFLQGMWLYRRQHMLKPYLLQVPVERILCDECGGTGMVRDPERPERAVLCPICQGVGGNYVRKLDKLDVLCPACSGMGRVFDFHTGTPRLCLRCVGRGVIRVE